MWGPLGRKCIPKEEGKRWRSPGNSPAGAREGFLLIAVCMSVSQRYFPCTCMRILLLLCAFFGPGPSIFTFWRTSISRAAFSDFFFARGPTPAPEAVEKSRREHRHFHIRSGPRDTKFRYVMRGCEGWRVFGISPYRVFAKAWGETPGV